MEITLQEKYLNQLTTTELTAATFINDLFNANNAVDYITAKDFEKVTLNNMMHFEQSNLATDTNVDNTRYITNSKSNGGRNLLI